MKVEQTIGPLLGTALMTAFDVGCQGGIPDARDGYSMLSMAQSLRGRLPITDAEARLRRVPNLPDPPDDRG